MPHNGRTIAQIRADIAAGTETGGLIALNHSSRDPELAAANRGNLLGLGTDGFSLLDIVDGAEEEGADGADGGPTSTVVSTTEDVTVDQETDVQRTGSFRNAEDRLINRTISEFVDLPTPEAVLDEFDTAFEGHLMALRAQGLRDTDLESARLLRGDFFNDYLADQAARAIRGEEPFRVVGAEGEPELVGTRQGDTLTEEGVEVTREDSDTQTTEQSRTEAQTDSTSAATVAAGDEAQQSSQQDSLDRTTTVDEVTRQETDIVGRTDTSLGLDTQEDIFSRPALGRVRAFSPLDFLQSKLGDVGAVATEIQGRTMRRLGAQQRAGGLVKRSSTTRV